MSILGGFLSPDKINSITAAVEKSRGRITEVIKSTEQQADVFFITVPVQSARGQRGFLNSLKKTGGIFANVQQPLA